MCYTMLYSLRVVCDYCNDKTAVEFIGPSRKETFQDAYKAGWRSFQPLAKMKCPLCAGLIKAGNHRSNREHAKTREFS